MTTRLLVIGDGKMGRAVAQIAAERGCEVVAALGPADMPHGVGEHSADVAVEFTEPGAAAANVRACIAAGLPVVSGTTGWNAELVLVRDEAAAAGTAFLHSPNFSIGVALFARLVEQGAILAAALAGPGTGIQLTETHHSAKKDAPSGTAAMLARLASDATGRNIPVTSIRVGSVPGTHELVIDAPFEQIRITHEARDRRVFADGAVAAAMWLVGKRGVFTFDDFIRDRLP